jgi:hypothetical protein
MGSKFFFGVLIFGFWFSRKIDMSVSSLALSPTVAGAANEIGENEI